MNEKLVNRTIKLPKEHIDIVKGVAEKNNRTFLGQIREIVKGWIDDNRSKKNSK